MSTNAKQVVPRAALAIVCASLVTPAAILDGCAAPPSPASLAAAESPAAPEHGARLGSVASPVEAVEYLASEWSFRYRDGQREVAHEGRRLTTPNYDIYTTISRQEIIDQFPLFMERALQHYQTALADLPPPPARFETYIFGNRRHWEVKTNEVLPGEAGMFNSLGRGGFSTRGIAVLYYIDYYGRMQSRDTLAIAAHEGWHQYTQKTFRNQLPVWLEEGVATYMEGFAYENDPSRGVTFTPQFNRERSRELGRNLHSDHGLIPLDELLSRSPQEFLEDGKEELLAYYAQVWALTRFLAEGEGGKYADKLAMALSDAADGQLVRKLMSWHTRSGESRSRRSVNLRVGPAVLLAYFTDDLKAFELEYLAFVGEITRSSGRPRVRDGR